MSSSVPAVLSAYKTVATNALPVGTQIVFSSVLPAAYQAGPGDVQSVGSGVTLQVPSVHFLQDAYAELGPNYKHEERYNIMSTLCTWVGMVPDDFSQLVQDVYTCYADLSIAINSALTLGLPDPKPRIAWPRQLDMVAGPDPFGRPAATITFELEVQARVESLS